MSCLTASCIWSIPAHSPSRSTSQGLCCIAAWPPSSAEPLTFTLKPAQPAALPGLPIHIHCLFRFVANLTLPSISTTSTGVLHLDGFRDLLVALPAFFLPPGLYSLHSGQSNPVRTPVRPYNPWPGTLPELPALHPQPCCSFPTMELAGHP